MAKYYLVCTNPMCTQKQMRVSKADAQSYGTWRWLGQGAAATCSTCKIGILEGRIENNWLETIITCIVSKRRSKR